MAKYKPVKGKAKSGPAMPKNGVPCLILLVLGMALALLFVYLVMKSSS